MTHADGNQSTSSAVVTESSPLCGDHQHMASVSSPRSMLLLSSSSSSSSTSGAGYSTFTEETVTHHLHDHHHLDKLDNSSSTGGSTEATTTNHDDETACGGNARLRYPQQSDLLHPPRLPPNPTAFSNPPMTSVPPSWWTNTVRQIESKKWLQRATVGEKASSFSRSNLKGIGGGPRDQERQARHFQHNPRRERTRHRHLLLMCSVPWQITAIIAIGLILSLYRLRGRLRGVYPVPHWSWDHNVYYNPSTKWYSPSTGGGENGTADDDYYDPVGRPGHNHRNKRRRRQHRNLLLTQIAGNPTLKELAEISSQPNRAYARQWGRDYALYTSTEPSLVKTCFDKVVVLNTILDRQEHRQFLWSEPRVQYDAIALFEPDTIITNLDYDLLQLIPDDKLLAMAGWDLPSLPAYPFEQDNQQDEKEDGDDDAISTATPRVSPPPLPPVAAQAQLPHESRTGVLFFNLRHRHANAVARLWWEWVRSPDITCGANNDLQILVNAIRAVVVGEIVNNADDDKYRHFEDEEGVDDDVVIRRANRDLESLICGLEETDDGFVGDAVADSDKFVLKGITPRIPTSRGVMLATQVEDAEVKLQRTADAVCYRYYPKCEVLM